MTMASSVTRTETGGSACCVANAIAPTLRAPSESTATPDTGTSTGRPAAMALFNAGHCSGRDLELVVGMGKRRPALLCKVRGSLVSLGVLSADPPYFRAVSLDALDLDVGRRLRHEDGGSDAQLAGHEGLRQPRVPPEATTMPALPTSPVSSAAS